MGGCQPVQLAVVAGRRAKLAPEVAKLVEPALGCRLQQVFGMAEGLLNYTRAEDSPEVVIGTQGRPLSPIWTRCASSMRTSDVSPGKSVNC